MQNGSGGESIWGKKFKDEKDGLKLKHDARGVLSMGNTGKNSNGMAPLARDHLTHFATSKSSANHVFQRILFSTRDWLLN